MSRRETAHICVACLVALLAILLVPAGSLSAAENDPNQRLPRFVSLRSDLVNLRVGPEGWVHERMVIAKRAVVIKGGVRALHRLPDGASEVVARAEPGVFAHLLECRGSWCRIEAIDISGWVQRSEVWGVYPDEAVQ